MKYQLPALIGNDWSIKFDECYRHELPEVKARDQIWFEQIPCRGGAYINLYSLEDPPILHLYSPRPRNAQDIYQAIQGKPGVRADFHYHSEADLYFPPGLVHIVAEMAGGKKKRRLSQDHLNRLAKGREKAGLTRNEKGHFTHSNGP